MHRDAGGTPRVGAVHHATRTAWFARWQDVPEGARVHERPRGDLQALADALGAPVAVLRAFLCGDARLLLVASEAGAVRVATEAERGFPPGPHGSPDVAAVTAAGGRVTGAIPPSGAEEHTHLGVSQVTYYAAELDLADGTGPRFVRGAVLDGRPRSGGVPDPAGNLAELEESLRTLRRLPASLADFRVRAREDFFGSHAGCRFDADL